MAQHDSRDRDCPREGWSLWVRYHDPYNQSIASNRHREWAVYDTQEEAEEAAAAKRRYYIEYYNEVEAGKFRVEVGRYSTTYTPPRADTASTPRRACPACGTWNGPQFTLCVNCWTPLPAAD